ncbi:hypothetical protein ACFQE5_08770 [Pseudonocardia hispaniensis]|uniref:Uncharacterized protein n=1 Tax=Pseudonocardia hispaniensis TaxID=904933 RepID=A0ABW1J0H0_9PSEU
MIIKRGSFGQWTTEYIETPVALTGAQAARWAETRANAERRRARKQDEDKAATDKRVRGGRERGRRGGRRAR